uniref:Uncharacterized protein n=1 Tax=Nelumbo nucifera TaxID=4432 RepID=A0A822YAY7_NELNU|nr:TPA_asm: hypothetical protein HUJ06_029917 [Nelumbo nucifera]
MDTHKLKLLEYPKGNTQLMDTDKEGFFVWFQSSEVGRINQVSKVFLSNSLSSCLEFREPFM